MGIGITKATPTLAVTDLSAARKFYGSVLEFEEGDAGPEGDGGALFRVGADSHLFVYERPTPSGSTATACSFVVEDFDRVVETLRKKGVRFEEYDIPEMGIRTVNGVARSNGMSIAWFRDPSGNILAIDDGQTLVERRGRPTHAGAQEGTHA